MGNDEVEGAEVVCVQIGKVQLMHVQVVDLAFLGEVVGEGDVLCDEVHADEARARIGGSQRHQRVAVAAAELAVVEVRGGRRREAVQRSDEAEARRTEVAFEVAHVRHVRHVFGLHGPFAST